MLNNQEFSSQRSPLEDVRRRWLQGRTNPLGKLELAEVGDMRGKSLLHLQCHFGLDTMSWARLGAEVTGLDFSDEAIKLALSSAMSLAFRRALSVSIIYDARAPLSDQFAVIFTSYGTITWLPDMRRWA